VESRTATFSRPARATSPATTSSESPGRKKPTASPVSAKMMKTRPAYVNISPFVVMKSMMFFGLRSSLSW
jgi:hypothetical protein